MGIKNPVFIKEYNLTIQILIVFQKEFISNANYKNFNS